MRSGARGPLARRLFRRVGGIAAALFLFVCVVSGTALFFSDRPDLYGGASFSRVFTDREGRLLRVTLTPDEKYRVFVPLDHIPADLREAVLLYEDRSFFSHPGVNPLSLLRAAVGMAAGGRRMGGSTITMQLVRLAQGLDTSDIPGKLRQMWRALVLERHYDKREILEAYLNLAPYGGNVEGVGAAALVWFRKRVGKLTLPEILALVPIPQNPAARNPLLMVRGGRGAEGGTLGVGIAESPDALTAARGRLHAIWKEAHPESRLDAFARLPLRIRGPAGMPNEAPHAVNGLLADMRRGGGIRSAGGRNALAEGRNGEIVTTLDLPLQRLVEDALRRGVARGRPWGMDNAAALLADWRSGEIRALAGSADFFNDGIQGQVDGTAARRSPGSTLKPFVYALALEQGLIHPRTVLADTPRVFRGYEPENADGAFRGPLTAREALIASRNIPAIALAEQLDPPGLYGFLRRSGVRFEKSAEHYGLALVLGGAETTMRELVGLYAALANRGLWREPVLLPRGGEAAPQPELTRVLSPEAAFVTLDMLAAPSPFGSSGVTVSWKTGTSNGMRDAWTVGVFGPYVLAVWVGRFDGLPNPGFTGMHAAAPLFFDIVRALRGREDLPEGRLRNPEGLSLIRIPVCAATGDVDVTLCAKGGAGGLAETWFLPGVSPVRDSGILREILVDRETGLRQCREIPGRTERTVWEFWPADMRRLFLQAGVSKPRPPAFAPECRGEGRGRAPKILSPRPGVAHVRSLSAPSRIPLDADVEADADSVFWFADAEYLGRTDPEGRGSDGEPLFWTPKPGVTELRAVDDQGRSARLRVTVETVP